MALSSEFFPISEISTYHAKWIIRARVTHKGQMRTFTTKDQRTNHVFECHLLDESSTEIRSSFFGSEALFEKLQQGKCYTFAKGTVRIANRQFNRCSHRYELAFDKDAQIEEVAENANIESIKFNFTDLHAVQSKSVPCTVDLCGVISSFRPIHSFTSKEGRELTKREIVLADDTATSMMVAIWGDRAKQEDKVFENNPVVCFKGVNIKEWGGGRTGSLLEAGFMNMQPQGPEVDRIRQWWTKTGSSISLTSMSATAGGSNSLGLVTIRSILEHELPCTLELCGIITVAKSPLAFTSRDGKELVKREVTVVDDSAAAIVVTLWGERANQDDKVFEGNVPVSLKGLIVKEWNGGRAASLMESGMMTLNPGTPDAERVVKWWSQGGNTQTAVQISQEGGVPGGRAVGTSQVTTFEELKPKVESVSEERRDVVVARLCFVQVRKMGEPAPLAYMACQEPRAGSTLSCNRRVNDGICPACNRAGKTAARLNIRAKMCDFGDSMWLQTFHEPAQNILGMTADEVISKDSSDRSALEAAITQRYYGEPFQVMIRSRPDTYNGEFRVNITCTDARPIQRPSHARVMLKNVQEMLKQLVEPLQVGGA